MFERQLGLRENPFLSGHQPKYVYPSREHQEALAHLRYGIQNREPFVLITGEVGTGKTTAVYDALAEWGARAVVALITNSALTRSELLEEICLRFGVAAPAPMSKPQTLVQLERLLSAVRARGELAILLLDEAQNLDRDLLEEIRLLSNLEVQGEKLLQIFLVGQPELEAKLAQPELRQLRQRIAIHYRISPLSSAECAHYIHHRVAVAGGNAHELFPIETCLEIFRVTNGIPREINIVAGQSLLNAFVEDKRIVTPAHVMAVEQEIEFQSVLKQTRPVMAADAAPVAAPMPARSIEPVAPVRPIEAAMPTWSIEAAVPARPVEDVPVARFETPPAARPAEPMPEPAPGPEPAWNAEPPASAGAAILPAWFDEVMARQKQADERARTDAPAEAPAEPPRIEPAVPVRPLRPSYEPPPLRSDPVAAHPAPPERSEPPARFEPPVARIEPDETETPEPEWDEPERPQLVRTEPTWTETARRDPAWDEPARPEPTLVEPLRNVIPMRPERREEHLEREDEAPALGGYRAGEREASIDFISPRLRAKLADAEEQQVRPRSTSWFVAALLLAVLAVGALLLFRFRPWEPNASAPATSPVTSEAPETAPAEPAAPAQENARGTSAGTSPSAPGSSSPGRTPAVSPARPATGPTASSATRPAPTSRTSTVTPQTSTVPAASVPAAPAPATAPSTARFGIAVGTYLNQERANAERASLSESTQLPARVVTVAEDNVAMYRVVMGSFGDRVGAERAASDLIRRGLVSEARVISLARVTE